MNLCLFDERTLLCNRCGYQARRLPTFRACQPPPPVVDQWRPILLGTLLSRGLAMIGITTARVESVTGKPCGCDARRNRLDEWGVRVQVRARKAMIEFRKFVLGD